MTWIYIKGRKRPLAEALRLLTDETIMDSEHCQQTVLDLRDALREKMGMDITPSEKTDENPDRFPGLDTEIPDEMLPTARTIAALFMLEKGGVVRLQFDDSLLDQQTAKQLEEIAGNVGYTFLWEKPDRVAVLVIPDDTMEV